MWTLGCYKYLKSINIFSITKDFGWVEVTTLSKYHPGRLVNGKEKVQENNGRQSRRDSDQDLPGLHRAWDKHGCRLFRGGQAVAPSLQGGRGIPDRQGEEPDRRLSRHR